MEIAVLEGETDAVRRFADAVTAETGVRHGKLSAVPVETRSTGKHSYLHHAHGGVQPHTHIRPKT
jgi:CopG family nickel-responsive transcriptional regulator